MKAKINIGSSAEIEHQARFSIGQKFTRIRPKRVNVQEETIIDIHTTINHQGDIIKIRYVCTHLFSGQIVTDYDVCDTTIARCVLAR